MFTLVNDESVVVLLPDDNIAKQKENFDAMEIFEDYSVMFDSSYKVIRRLRSCKSSFKTMKKLQQGYSEIIAKLFQNHFSLYIGSKIEFK